MRGLFDNRIRRPDGRRIGFLVLSFVILMTAAARRAAPQAIDGADFQSWVDLTTTYHLNDRFRYNGDQGARKSLSDGDWSLIYIRPSVRYDVRSWVSLHGGVGLFYAFQDRGGNSFELRPWQGLKLYWPQPNGFLFTHYFRIDQRNTYSTQADEWDTVLRARYQLQTTSPVFVIANIENIYSLVSIEFFDDVSGPKKSGFVDRIRFIFGVGNHLGEDWRIEAHYVFQISKPGSGVGFETEDHILRVKLFHNFN
ncbi:MAG: DUF2490 domain-containing protein [Candidatus Latescibacterota bacterium]|nr:MAG: DUF2490 domain-containing protein [Candidatus Latescibacterota bacterium]